MQFYLNGYQPGDPFVEDPHPSVAERPDGPPRRGRRPDRRLRPGRPGPGRAAGRRSPTSRTAVVDRRDGPLEVGQADGVACRTVEMFEAFGLADRLVDEALLGQRGRVLAAGPGRPDAGSRAPAAIQDVEDGLSEFPHVIVNQARMLAYLREHMERSAAPARRRSTACTPSDVAVDATAGEYPVTVTLQHLRRTATGETSTIRAKYVVGCDGARSSVRTAIGRELVGDATNQSWGVMDVLAVTDFPDIRLKCAIHSANQGNILIIPREGGYLVRLYIELDEVDDREMLENRSVTPEKLAAVANRILHPYTLEVKDVGWWSVYEIGQRLCDKFDDVPAEETATRLPRVFIAGDACHTHSAKAGQGMNVSMADAWNLGWKLGGGAARARPGRSCCTPTPRSARRSPRSSSTSTASSPGCSAPARRSPATTARASTRRSSSGTSPPQGRFTAGVATRYAPSMITAEPTFQHLAEGFPVGMRFHSAPVVRLADAKPVQLGHVARADGAWRLYVFADRTTRGRDSRARQLCEFLASDAVADRALHAGRRRPRLRDRRPRRLPAGPPRAGRRRAAAGPAAAEGRLRADRLREGVLPRPGGRRHLRPARRRPRRRAAWSSSGPDQYVAHVLPLDAHEALADFFAGILVA